MWTLLAARTDSLKQYIVHDTNTQSKFLYILARSLHFRTSDRILLSISDTLMFMNGCVLGCNNTVLYPDDNVLSLMAGLSHCTNKRASRVTGVVRMVK